MNTKIVVIETINSDGPEWGISFDGPNPEAKDYVRLYDSDSAYRLAERVNEIVFD